MTMWTNLIVIVNLVLWKYTVLWCKNNMRIRECHFNYDAILLLLNIASMVETYLNYSQTRIQNDKYHNSKENKWMEYITKDHNYAIIIDGFSLI